jgi:hypothetical protein
MLLELWALSAASDANNAASEARANSERLLKRSNGSMGSGSFVSFEELDYSYKNKGSKWAVDYVSDGKKLTKRIIPLGRIKEVYEIHSDDLQYSDDAMLSDSQKKRLNRWHDGILTVLETFDETRYYLDCPIEKLANLLAGRNNE